MFDEFPEGRRITMFGMVTIDTFNELEARVLSKLTEKQARKVLDIMEGR